MASAPEAAFVPEICGRTRERL